MLKSFIGMLAQLLKNKAFWTILIISLLITIQIPINSFWANDGVKMILSSIGVLLGGLLATIAIIFGIIKDEDLVELYKKHGDKFFNSLNRLKLHILLILFSFFISLLSYIVSTPGFIMVLLSSHLNITNLHLFFFIQITFALLTIHSTMEVVNILFLVFEIKFVLVTKKAQE